MQPIRVLLRPLALAATALAVVPAGIALCAGPPEAAPAAAVRPALSGNRGPFAVAFTRDGSRALVTEFDEGALAVIECASGRVLKHVPTGGKEPTGVAVTPDGALALVTNSFSGSLAFIDLTAGKAATVPLPGMPYDVVLSPDGATAFVSVSQLDQVAVVDVAGRRVTTRIPTGRRPRALALTPDGRVLVTANMTAGSVTYINTAALRPIGTGRTPAVNLRGVAVYPNGRIAYPVGQRAQNERPTETAIGVWSNQAFKVVPNGNPNGAQNIWLDLIGKDVSDPAAVVFDPAMRRAFITCQGGHSVNVLTLDGQDAAAVVNVGAGPRGLCFTPDGKELWVANELGNDLAVIDPESLKVTRRVPLGPTPRKDPHLLGRFLFNSATLTKGGQFSCNSCHPDASTDGISWKFTHVPDRLGKELDRNVRSLRGRIADTAPFRWSGHAATLEEFAQEEIVGLLQSPKLDPGQLRALVGFVASRELPPNPHRSPDGSLTPAARRGQALFTGKAACGLCHAGPKAGAARRAWVGTTPQGVDLDIPHLAGVYDTYPYLHNGRAATLEEIFTRYNEGGAHGNAAALTPEEMQELLAYVREL